MSLLMLCQQQIRGLGFFSRRSAEELWKTITSVSKAGRKKGRHKARKPIVNLNLGQTFGEGQIRTVLPGLNTPASVQSAPKLLPRDTEMENKRNEQRLDLLKAVTKRMAFSKPVHPLLRGYHGRSLVGQRLGPPPPIGDQTFEGFETICLEMRRRRIMSGQGRKMEYVATVIVGNMNGVIASNMYGWACCEGGNGKQALNMAIRAASKRLTYIERFEDRTIFGDFYCERYNSRLVVRRAEDGTGLDTFHRAVKSICLLAGIKDLHSKSEGASNKYRNVVDAFVTGLRNQETFQHLAERKQLHVVGFSNKNCYLPQIVASPIQGKLRNEEQLEKDEIFDVDQLWGEGRVPYVEADRWIHTKESDSYKFKMYKQHPFRNKDKVIERLLRDGVVERWTRTERNLWSEKEHLKVVKGEKLLPQGIGLSDVRKDHSDDKEFVPTRKP